MQEEEITKKQEGFIKLIILVVISLLVLKFFFEFDVVDYVSQDDFRTFARATWNMIVIGWEFIIQGLIFAFEIGKEMIVKVVEVVRGWIN